MYTTEVENEIKKYNYETESDDNNEETQKFFDQLLAENAGGAVPQETMPEDGTIPKRFFLPLFLHCPSNTQPFVH